jgi:hypothetical protein
MKAYLWVGGVLALLLLTVFWVSRPERQAPPHAMPAEEVSVGAQDLDIISPERAVDLAREAMEGRIRIPPEVEAVVDFDEERIEYTVTFPTDLPEGVLGSDFYAQVKLNAKTGEVLQRLRAR